MDPGLLSDSSLLTSGLDSSQSQLKRKRSPSSHENAPLALKSAKNASNHLTINYLARQYPEDLPLISNDDPLPAILSLLTEYQGVLDRHESMACNLGARPIGPILMSRFDRLFDGPPAILKSHNPSKSDPSSESQPKVTWLDVVEFARTKPTQFQLSAMSEGKRVCQFYTKQCRVQISEEDFLLVQSGMPQKLIPPQPIVEDEEKELGTLEIMEKVLDGVREVADQVAARTRQLNHRMRARKQAILDRRASDTGISYTATSPSDVALMNGVSTPANGTPNGSSSTPVGFVAVNSRQVAAANGASPATRNELMSKFFTLSDRKNSHYGMNGTTERTPITTAPPPLSSATLSPNRPTATVPTYADYFPTTSTQTSPLPPVAIPQSSNHVRPKSPNTKAQPQYSSKETHIGDKDDPQPHRSTMTAHVETLKKGERIIPPCDRCRRLQMDCVKNLTACQGCTRKHARCSWKDVMETEIEAVRLGTARAELSGYADTPVRSAGEEMTGYAQVEVNGSIAATSVPTANGVFTSEGISGVSAAVGVEGARSLALDAASAASLAAAAQSVVSVPEPPGADYKESMVVRSETDTPASSVAKGEGEVEREHRG